MVNADYQQNTNQGLALERMMSFIQRFGRSHFHLACHAAFPIALTPDLLYRIWNCFTPDAPWVAVSDVLLSSLCREVGYELYEMNLDVRSLLLEELKEDFSQQRLDELSDFLIQYATEKFSFDDSDKNSLDEQSLALAQEWTVLSYKKFDEISNRLKTLQQNLNQSNFEEFIRLVSLTQALPQSIVEVADLLVYANGVARWIRHDAGNAVNWFNQLPREGGTVNIGSESFNLPLKLKEAPEAQVVDKAISDDSDEIVQDDILDDIELEPKSNAHTRRKIRYGQILDRLTGEILRGADLGVEVSTNSTPYLGSFEVRVDYVFSSEGEPQHFMEVTQTDKTDSLRMKTLRYFDLVAEAKSHFGPEVSAISLIYGRPDQDLPKANFQSSLSFFDSAFLPRVDNVLTASEKELVSALEDEALKLAEQQINQEDAIVELKHAHGEAIEALTKYFRHQLSQITLNSKLTEMWHLEQNRLNSLEPRNLKNIKTHYKRGILQALYLTEDQFNELKSYSFNPETNEVDSHPERLHLPNSLVDRLIELNLTKEVREGMVEKEIVLTEDLREVLSTRKFLEATDLARKRLAKNQKIKWFFEDIQNDQRRDRMASHFLQVASQGSLALEEALYENSIDDSYANIRHSRCWMADLVAAQLQKKQSELGKLIEQRLDNFRRAGSTFTDFTMRYARVASDHTYIRTIAHAIAEVWQELQGEQLSRRVTSNDLSVRLLNARLDAAVKLNNFNPLHIALEKVLDEEEWSYKSQQVASILTDLAVAKSVGTCKVYILKKKNIAIYLNILYAKTNPTDKAKEWAARGRVLRYRYQNGQIHQLDIPMIFVCDGQWDAKSIRRLERGGWQTCTLDELPEILDRIST